MDWNGDAYMQRVEAAASIALGECAVLLTAYAKQRASVPVEKVGGKIIRSKPEEDPRRETGGYIRRLSFEHQFGALALTAYVGSADAVTGYLNVGTSKMRARPNLAMALDAMWPQIQQRIFAAVGRVGEGNLPAGSLRGSDLPRFSEGPGTSPVSETPIFSPSEIPF